MHDTPADAAIAPPSPWIGRRLLGLVYDLFVAVALWFVVAVPFVLVDVAMSGDVRHNIGPFSLLQWLLWLACWAVRCPNACSTPTSRSASATPRP